MFQPDHWKRQAEPASVMQNRQKYLNIYIDLLRMEQDLHLHHRRRV